MPAPFEPTSQSGDDSQQDVNYVPNEIDDTVKGGSALPGSAVEPTPEGGIQDSIQDTGFLGTRRTPDEDEK